MSKNPKGPSVGSPTDLELFKAFQEQRDQQAATELYHRHKADLWTFVDRCSPHYLDKEAVAAETWIYALRKGRYTAERGRFHAWLRVHARWKILDAIKAYRRRPDLPPIKPIGGGNGPDPVEAGPSSGRRAAARQELSETLDCMSQLTDSQRTALSLDLEDGPRVIDKQKRDAIYTARSKARKNMRKCMRKKGFDR